MSIEGLGELDLLERIKPYVDAQAGRDDAAVIDMEAGFTVATSDMFVEGVHFDFAWMSAQDAGWRSLALALGDLAAKGATPAWALVSLAMPRRWPVARLTGVYEGMAELAGRVGLSLVGGDMSAIDGPAVLAIAATGHAEARPLSRADARAGWSIGVTGPLGASTVALRARRPLRLAPQLEEGRRLNREGLCCGDVSDGLVHEMEKFAAMAGVGSVIQAIDVPCAPGASLEDALTSGEEAALVCVGPPHLVEEAGIRVIGRLTADPAIAVVDATGRAIALASTGYDHFHG